MTHQSQSLPVVESQLTETIAASWRKLVGIGLLWPALAALLYLPHSSGPSQSTVVALLGFAAFAAGLSLFADGLKRSIVAELNILGRS